MGFRGGKGPARTGISNPRGEAPQPGQRALGAMAEAARRAREATTGATPETAGPAGPTRELPSRNEGSSSSWIQRAIPDVPVESSAPLIFGPSPLTHATLEPGPPPQPRQEQRLMMSVFVVAAMVLGTGIALAVSLNTQGHTIASNTSGGTPTGSGGSAAAQPPPKRPSPSPTSTTPSPSRTSHPTSGGTAPVLSSLSPSAGSAGQTVVVSGSNFMSADGLVEARFGGQVAPTSCPVQTSCTLTVPVMTGPPTAVTVTITTDAGTSNGVTFDYSS
jgi:hypothetical protein